MNNACGGAPSHKTKYPTTTDKRTRIFSHNWYVLIRPVAITKSGTPALREVTKPSTISNIVKSTTYFGTSESHIENIAFGNNKKGRDMESIKKYVVFDDTITNFKLLSKSLELYDFTIWGYKELWTLLENVSNTELTVFAMPKAAFKIVLKKVLRIKAVPWVLKIVTIAPKPTQTEKDIISLYKP